MTTFTSRIRALSLLAFAAVTCTTVHADQKLIPAQSDIAFVTKQMGVAMEGRFKKFDAQVAFDPAKPEAGKIGLTIDIASATLGSAEVDGELPKTSWFNAAKFPQATFQSTAIKGLGGGKFEVAGKLVIKGNTQNTIVPVLLTQSGSSTTASGLLTIKRLAFKIGENEWADTSMVADDVQIKFKLALTGVNKL